MRNNSSQVFQPDNFKKFMKNILNTPEIMCEEVDFEKEGYISMSFIQGIERIKIFLGPIVENKSENSIGYPFGIFSPADDKISLFKRMTLYAGSRIQKVMDKYYIPLFDLFHLDEPEEIFIFDSNLFNWRIGDFLIPGKTRCGSFIFAGQYLKDDYLKYIFDSTYGKVEFRLDIGTDNPSAILKTNHLSLSILSDERTQKMKEKEKVENFLGFLISLCDPICARYALPSEMESVVVCSTQRWGTDLDVQFFAELGHDILNNFYIGFGLDFPCSMLLHGERECCNMGTYVPVPLKSFVETYMDIRPKSGFAERVYSTDISEIESIMGGEKKLNDAILRISNETDSKIIIVHDTCIVRVIGDDIKKCIEEHKKRTKCPLIYVDSTPMDEAHPFDSISNLWFNILSSLTDVKKNKISSSINLVGYGTSDDPYIREISKILSENGVKINASLFPCLSITDAERFCCAERNIVNPWYYIRSSFEKIEKWCGIESIFPPLPFGRYGTTKWLNTVLNSLVPFKKVHSYDMEEKEIERWKNLRKEAGKFGVGFIIASTQAQKLMDEEHYFGFSLIRFINEIGFKIHVMYYDPPFVRHRKERTDKTIFEEKLKEGIYEKEKINVLKFENKEELEKILTNSEFQIVYTEIRDDPRLIKAGKSHFNVNDLKMGYKGCIRTMERLLRRAKDIFYMRYKGYIQV